jgi:integrase
VMRLAALRLFERMSTRQLTSDQIELELRQFASEGLAETARARARGMEPTVYEDGPKALLEDYLGDLMEAGTSDYRHSEPHVRQLESPVYHELNQGMLNTLRQICRVELQRLDGNFNAKLELPLNPVLADPLGRGIRDARCLTQRLPELYARKKDKWSTQTLAQSKVTYRFLLDELGDKPPAFYERTELSDFFLKLARLPAVYGRSPKQRGWTLQQLVEWADSADSGRISPKTMSRHVTAAIQLFAYFVQRGEFEANPAKGHGYHDAKSKQHNPRKIWEGDTARRLFQSPLFTGAKSEWFRSEPGTFVKADARYFMVLGGYLHGFREEEFAQMKRKDLQRSETGIWYFTINGDDDKRLKNIQSHRPVPLHSQLERLGFVEYVQAVATGADDSLFPEFVRGGIEQKLSANFSKWFTRYRKAIGVFESLLDFHSFRTTVGTEMTVLGVQEAVIEAIIGHDPKTVLRRHYIRAPKFPLEFLREVVEKRQSPWISALPRIVP